MTPPPTVKKTLTMITSTAGGFPIRSGQAVLLERVSRKRHGLQEHFLSGNDVQSVGTVESIKKSIEAYGEI